MSHRGVFSPDAADTHTRPKTRQNKCILAHGLTFNKGFIFFPPERPPSEKILLRSCTKLPLQDTQSAALISLPVKVSSTETDFYPRQKEQMKISHADY